MFRAFVILAATSLFLCTAVVDPSIGGGRDTQKSRNFEVSMKNNLFNQKDITVSAGDTVRWINEDNGKHSVTPDTDGSPFKEIVLDGGTFSDRITFDKAGTFKYHCKFHPKAMMGTITVTK